MDQWHLETLIFVNMSETQFKRAKFYNEKTSLLLTNRELLYYDRYHFEDVNSFIWTTQQFSSNPNDLLIRKVLGNYTHHFYRCHTFCKTGGLESRPHFHSEKALRPALADELVSFISITLATFYLFCFFTCNSPNPAFLFVDNDAKPAFSGNYQQLLKEQWCPLQMVARDVDKYQFFNAPPGTVLQIFTSTV